MLLPMFLREESSSTKFFNAAEIKL